ncbi:MAG TPA: 5,6-dimethylbenzimidazole synthase [Acidimicrobiia bacterium]
MDITTCSTDLYQIIHRRRDVRAQFTGAALVADSITRILTAAHAAPSVGLTQPWDFILIEAAATKHEFWHHVTEERAAFAAVLDAERAARFSDIKIEGILESSLSIVVTYDPDRGAPAVLGRHAIADAGLYSVCLAIENLWLAATAEGYGVGWVSFYREPFLRQLLGIPEPIRPVAWLCIGPVTHLEERPDLERHGWRTRRALDTAIHYERWTDHAQSERAEQSSVQ